MTKDHKETRMPNLARRWLVVTAIASASLPLAHSAGAAQTTITISTTAPPSTPRIQRPFLIGAKPATSFVYAIPATGQAPLTFSVSGLPAGLTLNASSGVISGTAPAAGSYPLSVSVANGSGSASATITLVSGNMLRPTPPMGWNSYDAYGASIKESEVVQQAQAVKATLQPFGWNQIIIDYRWYDPEDKLDSNGRYLPSISKYPSATDSIGLKSLADQVHALGLGFGIHIMRGIPRSAVTANSPIASSTYHASDAGNTSDACPWDTHMWGVRGDTAAGQAWYDALFAQYAAWGIDFVKIDDMLNNSTKVYHQAEADAIQSAVDKSGRAIVVSFSPGPDDPTWLPSSLSDLNANADMWRVVDDFWDYNAITDLPGVFKALGTWQAARGLVQGHWPDSDMLPLGYLGPRCEWHASGETTFTRNQQVTILSLWSILPSPLIFGGNPQSLTSDTTTGPFTLALLSNEEALAINQDELGAHAKRIAQQATTEVWARDLSGGRKAVALFNRDTQDATVSVTFAQLGVSGMPAIRDVWQRADVTGMTTGISSNVPYGGALLFTLSPPQAGTGGAGGSSGMTGTGGTGARAGNAGSSGLPGTGGASAAAGSAGASATTNGGQAGASKGGAGGSSAAGGAAFAGGATGASGSVAAGGRSDAGGSSSSTDSGGCSCRTASATGRGFPAALFLFGFAALLRFRRRRMPLRALRSETPKAACSLAGRVTIN
jgi:alpha-galactosidase